jgi:hypothetical protein
MDENTDFINSFIDSIRKNGELEEYLKYAVKEEYVEFEMIFGSIKDKSKMLNKDQFIRLKDILSSSTNYISLGNKESLDIRTEVKRQTNSFPSSVRLTLEGLDDIKNYCRNDMLEPLRFPMINKRKYKDSKNPSKKFESIHSSEYPIRVNLKEELPVNNTKEGNTFVGDWQKKNKSFRFKKRYSFLTLNKVWRIDLTAIKQTKQKEYFKTFKESGLLRETEIFELEIEYVGNEDNINPFLVAPIIEFAKYANEHAFGNPFSTSSPFSPGFQDMGNFEGVDVNVDTTELYLSDPSPRYGYEFDEELIPIDSPAFLPDFITVKEDFWTTTKQEDIWTYIKDGVESDDGWNVFQYKLIPRKKEYDNREEVIIAEISPNINYKDKEGNDQEVKEIKIPTKYIIEDLYAPKKPVDDIWGSGDVSDSSDVSDNWNASPDDSQSGGSNGKPKKAKPKGKYKGKPKARPFQKKNDYKPGKKPQVTFDSSVYSKTVIDDLITNLGTVMVECFKIIYECSYFIPKNVENEIIKEYCKMTEQVYKSEWHFVGPQPVSMGIEHLNPYNPHSIVSGYAVTEKADGIRAELIVKDGRGYLLTPKKKLIDTGVTFDTTDNWIFDGEYITKNKKDENISLFMIFDVYYCSKASINPYELPWYSKKGESRSDIIREFRDTVHFTEWQDTMRIGFKQYFEGPDKLIEKDGSFKNLSSIFKLAKKIVDKEETQGGYEYYTDGLIFLPMFLPVKGTSIDDKVKSIKGTWFQNYKWKPPEENTIDFKVIFYKDKEIHTYNYETDDGRKEVRKYQKVQLAVQYNEKDDVSIDFNWALLTDKPKNKKSFQFFDPPDFKVDNIHITNIPLTDDKLICIKDNKSIENGQIVEMRYEPNSEIGYTWVPLRVRDDKEKPQYFTIANNIWKTINNPVSTQMIKGVIDLEEVSKVVNDSQEYYVDTYESEDTPIRDLHNYIKSKLISRIGSSPYFKNDLMIADLSCGRGGDIKKYLSLKNDIEFILGLDIASNINEAAQRYYHLNGKNPKAMFLQFDTSKSIMQKRGCLGNSELCENMLDIILNKTGTYPTEYRKIQKEYGGIAKQGFDIVSSQFSVHYYFKSEETLRGFCENVRDLCSTGGYFIGTCYDGKRVFDMFDKQSSDTVEMKDSMGSLIYQIKKKYDINKFDYEEGTLDDESVMDLMVGKEIEVFMSSIGQPLVEYLVNFNFFKDMMKEYGFEVAELPSFKKGEYNPINDPINSFTKFIESTDSIRENDKEFVKRTRNTDLYKVKDSMEYSRLCGLNNWFVFQKN